MAAETLRPDAQLSCSGLATCDFLEHDEDPDVSSVTINATGNNVNTEYGVDFPTPSGNPTVGAGLQEFRAGVEEFDSGQSGTPDARIELWENGALVRAGPNTPVSVYAVLAVAWNANELATADGSLVQCKVIGVKSGGSPSARNTVRIGHIEWNAEVDAGGQSIAVGQAIETDTASAMGKAKTLAAGLASDAETAFAMTFAKAKSVGQSLETDSGFAVSRAKTLLAGLASETDTAFAVTLGGQVIAVGLASEADTASVIGALKKAVVGIATENESAFSLDRLKGVPVGIPIETDSAFGLTPTKAALIGLGLETDSALALTRLKELGVAIAIETDTGQVTTFVTVTKPMILTGGLLDVGGVGKLGA